MSNQESENPNPLATEEDEVMDMDMDEPSTSTGIRHSRHSRRALEILDEEVHRLTFPFVEVNNDIGVTGTQLRDIQQNTNTPITNIRNIPSTSRTYVPQFFSAEQDENKENLEALDLSRRSETPSTSREVDNTQLRYVRHNDELDESPNSKRHKLNDDD